MNGTQLEKLGSILLLGLLLTSCANNLKDANPGALVGSIHAGRTCVGVTASVEVVAACAVAGGVFGANAVWNDDFNVHKSYFVDHLIGAPNTPNITAFMCILRGSKVNMTLYIHMTYIHTYIHIHIYILGTSVAQYWVSG